MYSVTPTNNTLSGSEPPKTGPNTLVVLSLLLVVGGLIYFAARDTKPDASEAMRGMAAPGYVSFGRQSNPRGKKGRRLTDAQRKRLPLREFVFPERRAWPIHDERHALIAVRYMHMGRGRSEEYPKIIKAIKKRYGKSAEVKEALQGLHSIT
jgi:hypothetical protein